MHQSLSLEQAKELKTQEVCPTCKNPLKEFIYKDSGEEFIGKKCTKQGCGYWGS